MKGELFDRYVEACNYPGILDEDTVNAALAEYCRTLGIERKVKRLVGEWCQDIDLRQTVFEIAEDVCKRLPKDARAARAARAARDARNARDVLNGKFRRFAQWCVLTGCRWYWWELSWLSTTYFGSDNKPKVQSWSMPLLDAFLGGCWCLFWTDKTLFWIAKPEVKTESVGDVRRLHCEDGPAIRNDVENLYFWHGVLVPAYAILCPEQITVEEIRTESNAEVRRALIERMTPEKYLWESKAELVDADREKCRKGAAPRCLVRDAHGDQWLVGTDGGTKRVYYMPVVGTVKTCREAHESICGFDESRILAKS